MLKLIRCSRKALEKEIVEILLTPADLTPEQKKRIEEFIARTHYRADLRLVKPCDCSPPPPTTSPETD